MNAFHISYSCCGIPDLEHCWEDIDELKIWVASSSNEPPPPDCRIIKTQRCLVCGEIRQG